MKQLCAFFVFVFFIFTYLPATAKAADKAFVDKAVLVTGASSGLGRKIAETLAEKGLYVYAGARKKKDIDELNAIENMQGVRLDVTKQGEIDAAVALVQKEGRGLYGLVNNAGVFLQGPLIEVSESDMQFIMDVNVFGPYRVTKAFAPMIIESKGRITTIGSIAGLNTGGMFGPYSMTKYAMEAFTDALAAEMKKFDVEVSIVEPGNFKSDIMRNMHKRLAELEKRSEDSLFKEEYTRMVNFTKADRSTHKEPIPVANAVEHAMFAKEPKQRYMVVPNQAEADYTINALMNLIAELNVGHEFSKGADVLVDELSKVLGQASGQ